MYSIKTIQLTHGKRKRTRLFIEFTEEKYEIISELLMSESSLFLNDLLDAIADISQGEKEEAHFSGNRTFVHITKEQTEISDLFIDYKGQLATYEDVKINTKKLQTIIEEWIKAQKEMREKNEFN